MKDRIPTMGWDKPSRFGEIIRERALQKRGADLPVRKPKEIPDVKKVERVITHARMKHKRVLESKIRVLESKIKKFLKKKTRIRKVTMIPSQKRIIQKIHIQKTQGFFNFD